MGEDVLKAAYKTPNNQPKQALLCYDVAFAAVYWR